MSHFHKWDDVTQDTEPGPTLPAGMSRRGIILGDIMLALHGAAAGISAEPHTHPNDQIAIMVEGSMLMEIDGEVRVIGPGEFAYVPKNVKHRIQTMEEGAIVLDVFCPFREDIAKRLAELHDANFTPKRGHPSGKTAQKRASGIAQGSANQVAMAAYWQIQGRG